MPGKMQAPDGWRVMRLGDVTERVSRLRGDLWPEPTILSCSKDHGLIPQLDLFQKRLAALDTHRYKIVHPGEFVYDPNLLWSGAITRSQQETIGIVSPVYEVFKTIPECSQEFLYAWLTLPGRLSSYRSISMGTNIRRRRADFGDFAKLPIPLPPLAEQRSIAAVLDAIDDAIERAAAVVAATERLRDALLYELLTRGVPGWHSAWREVPGVGTVPASWEVVRLGDVAQTITSGSRAWSQYFRPDGAFFVRSQNISDGTIDSSDAIFVQPPVDAEAVRTRIHRGDLLVSITGEPGKVTVAGDTLGQAYVSQHVALVRFNDPELSDFACEFLRGLAGQNQFRGMAYGQTRPGLSLINVSHARVAFPSSSERNTISDVGKSLHRAIEENRTERNRLRLLKASAADALLTGRVRVGGK